MSHFLDQLMTQIHLASRPLQRSQRFSHQKSSTSALMDFFISLLSSTSRFTTAEIPREASTTLHTILLDICASTCNSVDVAAAHKSDGTLGYKATACHGKKNHNAESIIITFVFSATKFIRELKVFLHH